MKRCLLFLFAVVAFSACSSDDATPDPIIGKWKMTKLIVDGTEFPQYPCDASSSITFKGDKTLSEKLFVDDGENDCFEITDYDYPGTWERKTDNFYDIITDEYGLYENFSFAVSFEAEFSENNNVMKLNVMELHEGVNDNQPYLNQYFFERVAAE